MKRVYVYLAYVGCDEYDADVAGVFTTDKKAWEFIDSTHECAPYKLVQPMIIDDTTNS